MSDAIERVISDSSWASEECELMGACCYDLGSKYTAKKVPNGNYLYWGPYLNGFMLYLLQEIKRNLCNTEARCQKPCLRSWWPASLERHTGLVLFCGPEDCFYCPVI